MIKPILLTLALVGSAPSLQAEPTAQPAVQTQEQAQLLQYESGKTDLAALAAEGTTVVFFFATWCPNCVMTLTELSQNWEKIDPSLTLVIADYDIERDLKAKYGVTYQDTFVLLDDKGEGKKLWNAGGIEGLHKNALSQ